jgi:hypothetical protein
VQITHFTRFRAVCTIVQHAANHALHDVTSTSKQSDTPQTCFTGLWRPRTTETPFESRMSRFLNFWNIETWRESCILRSYKLLRTNWKTLRVTYLTVFCALRSSEGRRKSCFFTEFWAVRSSDTRCESHFFFKISKHWNTLRKPWFFTRFCASRGAYWYAKNMVFADVQKNIRFVWKNNTLWSVFCPGWMGP